MTLATYQTAGALRAAYRPRSPAAEAAIAHFRRPMMTQDVRFALVREPTNPLAKPVAYQSLGDLARAIHTDREGAGIELEDGIPLNVRGWGELLGVGIWTQGESGERCRYIGWAWLDGGGRGPLEMALAARQSMAPTIGRRQGRAA